MSRHADERAAPATKGVTTSCSAPSTWPSIGTRGIGWRIEGRSPPWRSRSTSSGSPEPELAMRRTLLILTLVASGACATHAVAASKHPPVQDNALRAELLRRLAADQEVREQFVAAFQNGKRPDSALVARMASIDGSNTRWLADLVARRGWTGRSIVGADGADAAFALVQHADADTALQARVLPLLERAYRAGEATGQQVALLTDRLATARLTAQVYGTQADLVGGRAVPKPIRDSANVDSRRAAVGLPPLREYLRMMDSANTARTQR